MIPHRFLCLACLVASAMLVTPVQARTKAGITPLSACASKAEWETLIKTLQSRSHAYNLEFLGRVSKNNPNRQDKRAAARSAKASTKKGQPVDVNCRPLPGGLASRRRPTSAHSRPHTYHAPCALPPRGDYVARPPPAALRLSVPFN